MEFIDIQQKDFQNFLNLYNAAFPVDERRIYRDVDDFARFMLEKKGKFNVFCAMEGDDFLGFLSYWTFDNFIYVEHFAVEAAKRGLNIGGKMLDFLSSEIGDKILLEVELPETDAARRRIGFYERHGFSLRDNFRYVQPPYSPEQEGMELLLMTHGDVPLEGIEDVGEMLREVYNYNLPEKV